MKLREYSPVFSEEIFCEDFEGLGSGNLKLILVRNLSPSFRNGGKNQNERKLIENKRKLIENKRKSIENEKKLIENKRKLIENERNSIEIQRKSIEIEKKLKMKGK